MGSQFQKPLIGTQINWGHPLSRGIIGCWLMNEGAGDRIYDLSLNSNEGVTKGAFWIPSKVGPALHFSGGNEYVDLGSTQILPLGNKPFTVAVWAFYGGLGPNVYTILAELRQTSQFVFYITGNGTKFKFGFRDPGTTGVIYDITLASILGKWKCFVGVYNGGAKGATSSYSLYIDGQLYTTGKALANNGGAGTNNILGINTGLADGDWNGAIGSVGIHNRALTPQEVSELYLNPYGMFEHVPIWMIRAAAGWAHKFCGVSSPGKAMGIANANIGKIMGVAV